MTTVGRARLAVEIVVIYAVTSLRLKRRRIAIDDEVPRTDPVRVHALTVSQRAAIAEHLTDTMIYVLKGLPSTTCLAQSLILTRLLSRHDINSSLVIGVRSDGQTIGVHAWSEYEGVPLLDTGQQEFARLIEIETARPATPRSSHPAKGDDDFAAVAHDLHMLRDSTVDE